MSAHPLAELIYAQLKIDQRVGLTAICRSVGLKPTTANRTKVSRAMGDVAVMVTKRMPGYKLSRYYPDKVGGLFVFRIDQDDTVSARKWAIAKVRQSLSIQRSATLSLVPAGVSALMTKLIDAQAQSTELTLEVLVELDSGGG